MSSRGGKLGNSRLVSYTHTIRYCRICDKKVDLNFLNSHFRISHPEIYYNEYPGRRKITMVEDAI
jgi:hypothetical protein